MSCNCIKNLLTNLKNTEIHNIQCSICFKDNQDEEGINLCLNTLESYCSEHQLTHMTVQEQFQQYLNIKKEVIYKDYTGDKLAIGVEGGASHEQVIYQYTFNCMQCEVSVEFDDHTQSILDLNPFQRDNLKKILCADPLVSEKMTEWQLHLIECKCVKEIKFEGLCSEGVDYEGELQCMSCAMNSNLWLCLKCGYLGCGRKYYDGTGGNNHAIDHFTASGHCVNLKLGTLSSELDKTSMYCYKCDDDVRFNGMGAYLLNHFGINYRKFNKTEKSMVEMEIDLNMRFELSKEVESEMALTPLNLPGIRNLGNTCYANSVWQVIARTGLHDTFLKRYSEHTYQCKNLRWNCRTCQTLKFYTGLNQPENVRKHKGSGVQGGEPVYITNGINPYMYRNVVAKSHIEFKTNKQQDAMDYLSWYLEKDKNFIDEDMVQIVLSWVRKCTICSKTFAFTTKSHALILDMPADINETTENYSFERLLQNHFKSSQQNYECPNCKVKTLHNTYVRIVKTGKYLIFSAPRIYLNTTSQQAFKLNYSLNFSNKTNINLKDYYITDEEKTSIAKFTPDSNIVNMLLEFGLSFNQCAWICKLNNNEAGAAQGWLGENFDNLFNYDNEDWNKSDLDIDAIIKGINSYNYSVNSFVTHLGSNYGMGHYIAHIRIDKDKWIYFNDDYVYETSSKTTIDKAYIYFLKIE